MKRACLPIIVVVALLLVLLTALGGYYVVNETDQVIITQFGKPVGKPVTTPGLHFKIPFIQVVNRIEKRALGWDGHAVDMPTKDKTYIIVDTFARWRITDPTNYFTRLRDERSALSRLDDILGSETRTAIARHELIELIRTDKARKPVRDEALAAERESNVGNLPAIKYGRERIAQEIRVEAAKKLKDFGIELLDLRFKRVNYNNDVLQRIYDRMKSERLQIAQRFRSEGEGEAARIIGQKERDLNEIESTAYKEVQRLHGEADAKATEIYARSYNQGPQAAEFYRFTKTLETYRTIIQSDTSFMVTTDSEIFQLLKKASRPADTAPPAGSAPPAGAAPPGASSPRATAEPPLEKPAPPR
jgi:membrane protease subunit HflC